MATEFQQKTFDEVEAIVQRALADLGVKINVGARGAAIPAAAGVGAGATGGLLAQ